MRCSLRPRDGTVRPAAEPLRVPLRALILGSPPGFQARKLGFGSIPVVSIQVQGEGKGGAISTPQPERLWCQGAKWGGIPMWAEGMSASPQMSAHVLSRAGHPGTSHSSSSWAHWHEGGVPLPLWSTPKLYKCTSKCSSVVLTAHLWISASNQWH